MNKYKDLEKILLIDDDEATNYYNSAVIEDMNIDVDVHSVHNGNDAIDFLRCEGKYSGENCFPQPGLIFLDINMPGMNGWEFLDEYEKLSEGQKGKYVLAMLTTSVNPDDEEKSKQYNIVQDFIHKPLSEEKVMKIINKYF